LSAATLVARPSTAALASTTTATTRASSTATFAGNHGTGFVYDQRAAHEVAAVASFDGAIGCGVVVNFHEAKPACLAGKTITHYIHAIHGDTRLREEIR
jgi:hypothetical protein